MKKHLFPFLVQLVVAICIILYFVLIPTLVEKTYCKGVNYHEEYKIEDITKNPICEVDNGGM